jgi:hypothetical protein
VHESGFAQTLTGRITLPSSTGASSSDIDDAASARGPTDEASVSLPGNLVVSFSRPAGLASGQETQLHFVIRDSSGAIVTVEPYLGMPGHAIVSRDDGEVFAHLHGNGSFSMAAQDALLAVQRGDTLPSSSRTPRPRLAGEHLAHTPTAPGDLSFPFAFPSPGRYVVWLQFRHDSVRTAAFSLSVR